MGLEISDPVLLYIRSKLEIPPKGRKQAISGAFPSKWINPPVACYNAVIRDFSQN